MIATPFLLALALAPSQLHAVHQPAVAWTCDGETFRISFAAESARVTLPDGSEVELGRLEDAGAVDPESPRTFTDGRLTVVQETEGTAGPQVLLARGRMVPRPCERLGGEAATMWPVTKLLDRVWRRMDGDVPPGAMRIFLRDGTLLSDSCWETYRLSRWSALPGGVVVWSEDGVEVRAVVEELTEEALVLRLDLPGGPETLHFAPAAVPWVCPDLPR